MSIKTIHRGSRGGDLALRLILVGAAAACGGGDGGSGPGNSTRTIAKAATSGDGQTGTVGQALANPIRVLVHKDGQPEAGVTVTWAAPGTGAAVNPAASLTDAQGLAETQWMLPQTAGARTATASVSGASGSPVGFTATALPDVASQLVLVSGNNQTGDTSAALAQGLKVQVRDQFGNAVGGVTVAWSVTGGGGSIAPPSGPTDVAGNATATWTLGPTVGAQGAQAASTGMTGSPLAFSATGKAVPVGPVAVAVGNNFFSPANITINAGETVKWTWTSTGAVSHSVESTGSPSFTSSAVLSGNGQTYSFTFNTPGTYAYDCVVHGASMSGTVTVN